MKKLLTFLLISILILSVHANKEAHITCQNKQEELTEKQMKACIFLEQFSKEVRTLLDTNPSSALNLFHQALREWEKLLKNKDIQFTPDAIKHIEVVMWESGLKDTWKYSHSSQNIILSNIQKIGAKIYNIFIPTMIATGTDYALRKIFISVDEQARLRAPVTGIPLIVNFIYSQHFSENKEAYIIIPIVLICAAGYKHITWKQKEKLPFLFFNSETQIEEYIEGLQ